MSLDSTTNHVFAPEYDGSDYCTHPGCQVHRVDHAFFAESQLVEYEDRDFRRRYLGEVTP